jgi:hypothetical protein
MKNMINMFVFVLALSACGSELNNPGEIQSAEIGQAEAPLSTWAYCGTKIRLKSWKGDYLHRPNTAQGVTTWYTGIGNEWIVECRDNKIHLKSWKGDYLHRPDTAQGVTTWYTGIGNEWTVEHAGDKIKLRSWKGDYLHRPNTAQGVTTWYTGIGNEWTVELLSLAVP